MYIDYEVNAQALLLQDGPIKHKHRYRNLSKEFARFENTIQIQTTNKGDIFVNWLVATFEERVGFKTGGVQLYEFWGLGK